MAAEERERLHSGWRAAVARGAEMVAYLGGRAAETGSRVALYNHGGWFGEPENQVRIIEALPDRVDEGEARKEDKTATELATEKAELWKKGLGWWDQDGGRIQELRDRAGFTIYTPGSNAGVPLNIIGSLRAPDADWDNEAEALRDEIEGFVTGLLGLVEIEADPISSREHILIANLIEHAWKEGRSLDMATLLAEIQRPPLRKLGVFELDTFFPEKDRLELAMKLNGLVASPVEFWPSSSGC